MRICESDSPECSGINPCPFCYAFVFAKVLPNTIRAGGIASTLESAKAAMKAYDENWRKALAERVEEKKSASTEPFTTPMLLEFLAFKETRRKFLAQKKLQELELAEQQKVQDQPQESTAAIVEPSVPIETNGHLSRETRDAPKGNRPARGDVRRIAEKQAKESLAPGKSHSAAIGNNDSGVIPAARREEKH